LGTQHSLVPFSPLYWHTLPAPHWALVVQPHVCRLPPNGRHCVPRAAAPHAVHIPF
jgi:hypothetical protein